MFDSYAREINYLRVSVIDRCNLRCKYCMPEEGIEDTGHENILSLEEIAYLIRLAARVGIFKVRLTGGEPLVRKNIIKLVEEIAAIPQINEIAMTTNGILFAGMAEALKSAGLTRVNFSLDSLNEDIFNYITSWGKLKDVLGSIFKALELGMAPVKVNTVIMRGINDHEILDFVKLAYQLPLHVRFIEFMPVGNLPFYNTDRVVRVSEIKEIIAKQYELLKVSNVQGSGPAKCYNLNGGVGTVGFISPMSDHFCFECNRLRLTADGKLRSCLFGKQEISLKLAMQNHVADEKIVDLFSKAIREKPQCHHLNQGWGADNTRKMYQIGG